jgi:hypothetical protein
MFNLKQQLTVNLISVKQSSIDGKNFLTLWVYQAVDSDNKNVCGGEVMKLSAEPDLYLEFRALFLGVTSPLVQCEITADLKTGAANSTKLHVVGVKAIKQTNSTAKNAV